MMSRYCSLYCCWQHWTEQRCRVCRMSIFLGFSVWLQLFGGQNLQARILRLFSELATSRWSLKGCIVSRPTCVLPILTAVNMLQHKLQSAPSTTELACTHKTVEVVRFHSPATPFLVLISAHFLCPYIWYPLLAFLVLLLPYVLFIGQVSFI
jgi:hypothetical protein